MPNPTCDFGKCIIAPLHQSEIELTEQIRDLNQAIAAGVIQPENQGAAEAQIIQKQADIDRLKIEMEVNLSKVCDHCPYKLQNAPGSLITVKSTPTDGEVQSPVLPPMTDSSGKTEITAQPVAVTAADTAGTVVTAPEPITVPMQPVSENPGNSSSAPAGVVPSAVPEPLPVKTDDANPDVVKNSTEHPAGDKSGVSVSTDPAMQEHKNPGEDKPPAPLGVSPDVPHIDIKVKPDNNSARSISSDPTVPLSSAAVVPPVAPGQVPASGVSDPGTIPAPISPSVALDASITTPVSDPSTAPSTGQLAPQTAMNSIPPAPVNPAVVLDAGSVKAEQPYDYAASMYPPIPSAPPADGGASSPPDPSTPPAQPAAVPPPASAPAPSATPLSTQTPPQAATVPADTATGTVSSPSQPVDPAVPLAAESLPVQPVPSVSPQPVPPSPGTDAPLIIPNIDGKK